MEVSSSGSVGLLPRVPQILKVPPLMIFFQIPNPISWEDESNGESISRI